MTLNVEALNPPTYFFNVTSYLQLRSNVSVQATLYDYVNNSLIARGTYIIPDNTFLTITTFSPKYMLDFSSSGPFEIEVSYLKFSFTAYNNQSFNIEILNSGTLPLNLYALWIISNTTSQRLNTSLWLDSSGSKTFTVNIPVTFVKEIRAITTTRVYVFRINIKPPAYAGVPVPGGATYPHFTIYSYNSSIVGTPSSSERLVVGIVNNGGASGVAVVRVLDSSGNVASSASVSLSPGQRTDVSLSVVLPPASGNYQWRIVAINSATGNQDDARTVLVQVVTYTPVFYIASYTGNITGAVSSRQLFNVTVTNTGNATGTVRVRVLDQAGNTVNSTVLAVSPGASVATSLALTLPSSSGTYSWTVQAVDNATGTIHDSKPITVRAVVYQPKFSIRSYNTSITGAAGSKQKIVVAVANTGNATGAVQVSVVDNNGNTVNSTQLTLAPGINATTTIYIALPTSTGTYTWKIQALNLNTTRVDDEKTVQVSVVTYLPVFRIVSYNSSISGPVGSRQRLVVTVQNTGNASGNAVITVIDQNGNTVNSTTLSIPAGQTATATLTVTLPSSKGTYTWKINVTNQATGKIDDTKTLLVRAKK